MGVVHETLSTEEFDLLLRCLVETRLTMRDVEERLSRRAQQQQCDDPCSGCSAPRTRWADAAADVDVLWAARVSTAGEVDRQVAADADGRKRGHRDGGRLVPNQGKSRGEREAHDSDARGDPARSTCHGRGERRGAIGVGRGSLREVVEEQKPARLWTGRQAAPGRGALMPVSPDAIPRPSKTSRGSNIWAGDQKRAKSGRPRVDHRPRRT